MILTIRTDNPEAEIGLYGPNQNELFYLKWQAHRQLSETILIKIKEALDKNSAEFKDISGVVFYEGPGSFTGLRIGASVANAFDVPVANCSGANWQVQGLNLLADSKGRTAIPRYGAEPHITKPKK